MDHEVEQFLRTLERQNRCLIFCRLGVNRSAAVGIALMMRARSMKKPGLTGDDLLHRAFRDVTKRHGRVLTNYGFQRQLLLYASNSCRWSTTWGSETWLLLSDANQEMCVCCESRLSVKVPSTRMGHILDRMDVAHVFVCSLRFPEHFSRHRLLPKM